MTKLAKSFKVVSQIIFITVIVKFLGFIRVILMAKAFGTGIEASAFEAAYRLPGLIFTSIGVAITTTFIPIFTDYLNNKGKKEALFFSNNIINVLSLISVILSVIGIIFAPFIVKAIYWGYSGEIYNLTVSLVRIMFPIIIFIGLSFVSVGMLQSFSDFKIPAMISLPSNIINILYLILLGDKFGVFGFAVAVLIGWSTQWFIQIPSLRRNGYKYNFILSVKHEGIRKMLKMVVPIILGTSVQQINLLINSALASNLGNGAIAALGYANNLYIIIVGIFTYALSAVVFPSLSKLHAIKDYEKYKSMINDAIKIMIFILFPIMIGILVLRVPIIKVLLQRGKFNFHSTLLTSTALFYYSLGMVGFGIQEILNRAFYATHDTKTPMKIGVLGMLLNIILNLILVKYMNIGGLAFSASVASMFVAFLLVNRFSKKINNLIEKGTIISTVKVFVSSLIMGVALYYIYNSTKLYSVSFIESLIFLLIYVISGALIYYISAVIMKNEEALAISRIIKTKFQKVID